MKREISILVVDDSITTRDFICSVLKEHGFIVQDVENGQLALDRINKHNFDLLIVDLLMPVMNGFELLEALQKNNTKIPVIILTADIQDEVKEECFSLGAKDFLNKPIIDPSVLINAINDQIK